MYLCNTNISGFRSPQFKRQQEKTQQVKRLLELENEIDEKNYCIESKEKELEALSELLKVSSWLPRIGYWLRG